jgi:hypothetical protein
MILGHDTLVDALAIDTPTFGAVGLVPTRRAAKVAEASVTWSHTTVLNPAFLALAAVQPVRFLRACSTR